MLVIGRREGERIIIDVPGMEDKIVIEIVRIGPPVYGAVRLGITATPDVTILREELTDGFKARRSDVRVVGSLPSDPAIPVLQIGEAAGDVGGDVREGDEQ